MEWTEAQDLSDNHLQQKLVRYVHGCQIAAAGEHMFGINADKGSGIGGQSLQSTVVFLRNGAGLLMPPQAPFFCSCYCMVFLCCFHLFICVSISVWCVMLNMR